MDVAVLRDRIVATLDADADARRRAELDLKTVRMHSRAFYKCPVLTLSFAGRRTPRLHRCPSRYPPSRARRPNPSIKYARAHVPLPLEYTNAQPQPLFT